VSAQLEGARGREESRKKDAGRGVEAGIEKTQFLKMFSSAARLIKDRPKKKKDPNG